MVYFFILLNKPEIKKLRIVTSTTIITQKFVDKIRNILFNLTPEASTHEVKVVRLTNGLTRLNPAHFWARFILDETHKSVMEIKREKRKSSIITLINKVPIGVVEMDKFESTAAYMTYDELVDLDLLDLYQEVCGEKYNSKKENEF